MKKLKWLNISYVFNKIKHALYAFKTQSLYSHMKKALTHKLTFNFSYRNTPDFNTTTCHIERSEISKGLNSKTNINKDFSPIAQNDKDLTSNHLYPKALHTRIKMEKLDSKKLHSNTQQSTQTAKNPDSKKPHKRMRYNTGFSMMELLFVLVIIGILASLALPRISFSRNNALSVAIQSDIQTIISSTQEYAITNEFMPQNANPQWLVSYLHLSPQRWVVSGDSLKIAKNGVPDSQNDCLSIRFNQTNALEILFNRSQNSNLCQNLLKNYASDIIIPLHITP